MKAVILAGGFGTRISEETDNIPKPMIQIGNKPILWHIMKLYSYHGVNDFIICLSQIHNQADYITINISSPNTEGLRDFHERKFLS